MTFPEPIMFLRERMPRFPIRQSFTGEAVHPTGAAINWPPDCYTVRRQVLPDPDEANVWHGVVFWEMGVLSEV